ncbi:dihydroxyacetone kinase phosphoryl donor subunit DhaM [Arcanobacterium ihumii]|uniref:dihydroxyacetone kinase phosphoryl donor subunit DhaM n=1 Tax=Arcanobacterium ihumii TaxID=2138162 RepID=UPI000F538050|nr:dihydroxyacetone kinase phosphoryl donor subunit DhaM [Arcanobacterium ihumii]
MSVGIVVVSHSRKLAQAAVDLANIMVHANPPKISIAAGLDDGSFGTDATQIMTSIDEVDSGDGVVIFVDMGSAVMSAQTAIDLLESDAHICSAPFVEGITAGVVAAATGNSMDQVIHLAENSLNAKRQALGEDEAGVSVEGVSSLEEGSSSACEADVEIVNDVGLHARPAGRLAQLVSEFDARVEISSEERGPVEADSMMDLMSLGAGLGDVLHIRATGAQDTEALDAIVAFVREGMGE